LVIHCVCLFFGVVGSRNPTPLWWRSFIDRKPVFLLHYCSIFFPTLPGTGQFPECLHFADRLFSPHCCRELSDPIFGPAFPRRGFWLLSVSLAVGTCHSPPYQFDGVGLSPFQAGPSCFSPSVHMGVFSPPLFSHFCCPRQALRRTGVISSFCLSQPIFSCPYETKVFGFSAFRSAPLVSNSVVVFVGDFVEYPLNPPANQGVL